MTMTMANGIRISYEIAGAGPLVVLNHGLNGSLDRFRALIERLKSDYTLLAWDNRGCGGSEAGGPYSLRLFSEDLYGLMTALGLERGVIVGVSWGGVLAQRFALDHPAMVRGLVLDSTSSAVNERAAEGWLAQGRAALAGEGGSGDPEAFMGRCQAVAGLKDAPLTPELGRIASPTLVIVGEDDRVAGAGGSVILHRAIPSSTLRILPGVGHAVAHLAPSLFELEFRAFMASLPD